MEDKKMTLELMLGGTPIKKKELESLGLQYKGVFADLEIYGQKEQRYLMQLMPDGAPISHYTLYRAYEIEK